MTTPMIYRPRHMAAIDLVLDGRGEQANSKPLRVEISPISSSVVRNGYHEADTWSLEFDARSAPFDPEIIASVAVRIYMWDAIDDTQEWATEENEMVRGLADSSKMRLSDDGQRITIEGRDYTGILDPEWDPRERIPFGLPLDRQIQAIADAAAPPGRTGRFLVVWESDRPVPIVGAARRSTAKKGMHVKQGKTYMDVIYEMAINHSFLAFVRGSTIVITDARAQTKASAALAPRLVHGVNLDDIEIERRLAKERVPQIKVVAWNPRTKKHVEVTYPPNKTTPTNAIGIKKNETLRLPAPPDVYDPGILLEYAKMRFDLMSRAETTYKISTSVSRTEDKDGKLGQSLFRLQAGEPISIGFEPFGPAAAFRKMSSKEAREDHLVRLGYQRRVASFIAEHHDRLDQFEQPYYIKSASFSMSSDDGLSIEIEGVNYASQRREEAAAP